MFTGSRKRLELARGWQFSRRRRDRRWLGASPGTEDGDAVPVELPHCWNSHEAYRPGVAYYQGYGSYRLGFRLSSEEVTTEAVWRLEADGFYGLARVWLNGTRLAKVDGQYLGFWLDPGTALRAGENVLGLLMDNRTRPDVLPGHKDPDFLLYGGLSGGVRLWRLHPLHLQSRTLQLVTDLSDPERAKLTARAAICNDSRHPSRCRVSWELWSAGGELAGATTSRVLQLEAGQRVETREELEVSSPQLWSPRAPRLYRAVARLEEDGVVRDRAEIRVGLRQAEFERERGFLLNGEPLELHGSNRHASLPGFGHAMPASLHRRDAELLAGIGSNLVRLSHYPQAPAFLDACDELGLLVYAELTSWKTARTGRWLRAAKRQLASLIRRDRNRPSIVVWGLANERRSRRAFVELRELAKRLDPTRPVSYAEHHFDRARRERTLGVPDVWGVNYELERLDEARDAGRTGSVLVTECMNPHLLESDDDLETRHLRAMEKDWTVLAGRPWVAGYAQWCFADYATLHRQRYRRQAGLFDAWRQPKPAADLFRARHTAQPFVSLHGEWGDHPGAPARRLVRLFTNCRRAELRLGSERVAEVDNRTHAEWEIDFHPADLVAVGSDGSDRVEGRLPVHGEPVALGMTVEAIRDEAGAPRAIDLRVEDRNGNRIRCRGGSARVTLTGPGRLRTYAPEGEVEIVAGRGRCFFEPSGEPGCVELRATAPGLEPASATVLIEQRER
jgi:beta-galactosidase